MGLIRIATIGVLIMRLLATWCKAEKGEVMKLLEQKMMWCDDAYEWELLIDYSECMPTIRMWRDGKIIANRIILADGSECESPRKFEPWPEFIEHRFDEAVIVARSMRNAGL